MSINRWFTRCTTCLVITAIDERPAYNAVCGLCGGSIENMGRVERERLVEEHLACKCDDRCTSARGPLCTCKCGAANHGAGIIGGYHMVTTDKGPIPTVTPKSGRAQAEINAREYRAARAAALAVLDELNARRAGNYLPASDYGRLLSVRNALRKANDSRNHKTRLNALRAVASWETPNPIHDFAEAINNAPKVADVPFALSATSSPTTPAKQTNLF